MVGETSRLESVVDKAAPIAKKFFEIKEDPNFWEIINSPVLVAVVAGYLAYLIERRFKRVEERAEDERKRSDLEIEAQSVNVDVLPAGPGEDYFAEAANIIQQMKDFVEEKVSSIVDGRKLRKYETLGRQDYRVRVLALSEDDKISEAEEGNLLHAFSLWRPYRTHRQRVPLDVRNDLRARRDAVLGQ